MNTTMNIELLNKELILSYLQPEAKILLDELILLETVDSTNDYLLRIAHLNRVIACFAEQQTSGKGQRGKSWTSPRGQIYFSLLWTFQQPPHYILGLSLAIGISVARSLQLYGIGDGLAIKWPNDVYYQNKKLVGILVETVPGSSGIYHSVSGVGINLFPYEIQINQPWTYVQEILQSPIERNRLAGLILNELLIIFQKFSHHGLEAFLDEWRQWDYLYGKKITITTSQVSLMGIMQGISSNGELLLLDEQNQIRTCLTGTVRLTT